MAGPEDLDGYAVAHLNAPAFRRPFAHLFDHTQRLVPRDQREHPGTHQVAAVLLHVAPAHAAGFDAQQSFIRADRRPVELTDLVRQRSCLYGASNHQNPPGIVSSSYSGISGNGSAFSAGGVYPQYLARAPPSITKSQPVISRA